MQRDHDRPPSVGPKRLREWDEPDSSSKKPASDENRAQLNNLGHRRPSTPPPGREPYRRNSSEARHMEQRRMEDQRRDEQRRMDDMRRAEEQQRHGNDGYHPSEAAHHPPSHQLPSNHLPPMQQGPSPMQNILHDGPSAPGPAPKEYPPEERQAMEHGPAPRPAPINEPERAARKMEVDEDYDDSGEDEKKGIIATTNGSGPASTSGEMKTATPTSAGMNGMIGPAPKVEST